MSIASDTIFALATPFAKSGVAVIRVSGPRAREACKALTKKDNFVSHQARLSTIYHPTTGESIDKSLFLYFAAPRSFTGEDVLEIHCHGSLAVIREILEVLGKTGFLRHAEAGEFTRRAYLNGKLDLLEAEGLADLIDAETPAQRSQAMRQMQGLSSGYYNSIRARMVESLAFLEAYIDFPDEDIPASVLQSIEKSIESLKSDIRLALADNRKGERLREGIHIAILGAPNVGKSSILNRLSNKEAAIVSPVAGTTRDIIEVPLFLSGFPVILSDTAGIRQSTDIIEEEGVRRALHRAGEADIRVLVVDSTQELYDSDIFSRVQPPFILVLNKVDLLSGALTSQKNPKLDKTIPAPLDIISVSAKTGQGVDHLLSVLEITITTHFAMGSVTPMITRARHRQLLEDALGYLDRFRVNNSLEFSCEELRSAALAIGKITGKIHVDELLDSIFKTFCIGK